MSPPSEASVEDRERVRDILRAAGFARVRFTGIEPVDDVVSDWVDAGRHASLEWMARDPGARADPTHLMASAASVICVAAAYPATDARGAIAGYARGEDYHRTLRHALDQAMRAVGDVVAGVGYRLCVDAEPLLERSLAARAGVGWVGRNTMVLDEEHGPWLLLGEVLVDVEFPPDPPAIDRCGTCTACVEACPTVALDGKGGLDARRCLSYWTIEHRGPLPDEWGEALGHRLFGCDDCLTACPFPRTPPLPSAEAPARAAESPFVARPDLVSPDLDALEARAQESFKRHFGSTPLERARKGGVLRNLAHVRSNLDAAAPPDRP